MAKLTKPKEPHTILPVPILIDTREQQPFAFQSIRTDKAHQKKRTNWHVETMQATLETGDYSLQGYVDHVAVERKSKADLFGTLGQGRERFERELERLRMYRWACVVVEADWGEVLSDPPPFTALKSKTVYRSILAWMARYPNIHWLFVPGREVAENATFRYLLRICIELGLTEPPLITLPNEQI